MILCLDNVLTAAELEKIQSQLRDAAFIDGKLTAGRYAQRVKANEQLPLQSPTLQELRAIIEPALNRHPLFNAAIQPKIVRPVLISRYQTGMAYGVHTDNALMKKGQPLRSDVALTLFLSDPDTYRGGELVIDTSLGEQAFKLAAGSAITYPATMLHRVAKVSEGVRLAAVTWIQSYVRDAQDRELLFEIDTVRRSLFAQSGKTAEFDLLCKTHSNLLRKWADL